MKDLIQYCKRIGMKRLQVYKKYFQNKISITQFEYFWYCFKSRVETSKKYFEMPLEKLKEIVADLEEQK